MVRMVSLFRMNTLLQFTILINDNALHVQRLYWNVKGWGRGAEPFVPRSMASFPVKGVKQKTKRNIDGLAISDGPCSLKKKLKKLVYFSTTESRMATY